MSRAGQERPDELDVVELLLEVRLNRQLGDRRSAGCRLEEAWLLLDQLVDAADDLKAQGRRVAR